VLRGDHECSGHERAVTGFLRGLVKEAEQSLVFPGLAGELGPQRPTCSSVTGISLSSHLADFISDPVDCLVTEDAQVRAKFRDTSRVRRRSRCRSSAITCMPAARAVLLLDPGVHGPRSPARVLLASGNYA
jgi:hypothetical protein